MIASVIGESMSVGFGGMIQMGEPQYPVKTLSHCNFFHHESQLACPGIEPEPTQ